jgi:hypothetical protein
MKNVAIILITLLALLTSCNLEDSPLNELVEQPLGPENTLNPYDHFGKQHNEGLKYLSDTYGTEISAMWANDPTQAEAFVFEKAIAFTQGESGYYPKLRETFGMRPGETMGSRDFIDLEKLLKTPPYNPWEMTQLQTVIDDLTQMPHSTTKELNAIITKVIAYETKYLNHEKMEHEEAFLGALSVLRYSAHYWGNDEEAKPRAARPWWQIVLGDCIGAGVGTLLGGPATGVGLGTGVSMALKDDGKD